MVGQIFLCCTNGDVVSGKIYFRKSTKYFLTVTTIGRINNSVRTNVLHAAPANRGGPIEARKIMSIKINVSNGYNERFAPAGAKKAYLARITGRDSKMGFAREFLGKDDVYIVDPGIYERRETDKKGRSDDSYILVLDCPAFPTEDGDTLRTFVADKEQATKIAKAMDDGRRIDAIAAVVDASSKVRSERTWEFVTVKKAESRAIAQTIDAATESCWAILQALPEKEAKKVLAALRVRVTPPKAAADLGLVENTPVGIVSDVSQESGATQTPDGFEPTQTDEPAKS